MRNTLAVLLFVLFAGACVMTEPEPTPLELQAFQQREFPAAKRSLFAATVSSFQDLGYIVDAADFDTGLITVSSPASGAFVPFVGMVNTQARATAFVEEAGQEASRVRLNFVTSTESQNAYGQTARQDERILDPEIYQQAFERIDVTIFARGS